MVFYIPLPLIKHLTSHQMKSSKAHSPMFSYSLQNVPLNLRPQPQPQPWDPTIYNQTSLFICWDLYHLLSDSVSPWTAYLLGHHLLHLAGIPGLLPSACQDCLLLLPSSVSLNNKPTSLAGLSPR